MEDLYFLRQSFKKNLGYVVIPRSGGVLSAFALTSLISVCLLISRAEVQKEEKLESWGFRVRFLLRSERRKSKLELPTSKKKREKTKPLEKFIDMLRRICLLPPNHTSRVINVQRALDAARIA